MFERPGRTCLAIAAVATLAFALPAAGALPKDEDAQAQAEIALDLAILKYARFARGGRYDPSAISDLLDQAPPLRDPETVIAEIGMTSAPDAYLRSLHPSHEQFVRLREARGIEVAVTGALRDSLARDGFDPQFGARPLKRLIQTRLLNELAREIVDGRIGEGNSVTADWDGDRVTLG